MLGASGRHFGRVFDVNGDSGPPEDFLSYYAHDGEYDRRRVYVNDAEYCSFRVIEPGTYGSPPTKRGYEFFVLDYFDERTGTLHKGVLTQRLSSQSKDEIDYVVRMCRMPVDGYTPQLIASATLAPDKEDDGQKLECDICQGQHQTKECRYPCHHCISEGPKAFHVCGANIHFRNISQNRIRTQILYQLWRPGTVRDGAGHRPHFTLRRRPIFRKIPVDWQQKFEEACTWFNGQIKLVDNTTYNQWRERLSARGSLEAPFLLQAPYRMLGFLNIEHTIELLEKVYVKVVEARQMVRSRCPNVTLTLRRHWTGQREPDRRIVFENLQEVREVIVRLEDYRPDEEPLHAELGCAKPGSAFYIFPYGHFEVDDKGSAKLPSRRYKQVLKKLPYHPDNDKGKLELVFDAFGPQFNLRAGLERYVKKPKDLFKKHLVSLELESEERDKCLELFDTFPDHDDIIGVPHEESFRLTCAGIAPSDIEDLAYEFKGTDNYGWRVYEKVSADVFQRRLLGKPEISEEFYPSIHRFFEAVDPVKSYSPEACKLYDDTKALPISYDYVYTLAHYVDSEPKVRDIDVALDQGLAELEWTLGVYKGYRSHIELPHIAARKGVREMFGPHGLGCLRVVCECFLGGPSTNDEARAVFEGCFYPTPNDALAKRLWPRPHSDGEMHCFLETVLGFTPNEEQACALRQMICNRLFVLIGPPGSGKTELTCAAALYMALVHGERILMLTETNHGANDMRNTLARMLQVIEKEFPWEINEARKKMRNMVGPKGMYRWVTHSLANCREYEDEVTKTDRVGQSKGRKFCEVSRIVVSTLGHARSKAVQLFQADTIVVDEAARSSAPRVMGTLLERWLNTSKHTTRIKADRNDDGRLARALWNDRAAQRLILVGDPAQGLPQVLVPPITDKKIAWDLGEYDNVMTIFMNCGAPFVRLSRVLRTSYFEVQPILDRFYNYRLGAHADAATEVVAVKDAPAEVVAEHHLPSVEGNWLHCERLRALLGLNDWHGFYDSSDDEDNIRLRHLVIRTNPGEEDMRAPEVRRLSYANKNGSQVNLWHQEVIRVILSALFEDGEIVDPKTGSSEKVSAEDILVMAPYNGQVNQIRAKLSEWFPHRPDLGKLMVLTMEQVQGLQRPIIITDFTKDKPSDFLLGHHTDVFQTHHNKHYSVGLTRPVVAQLTLACFWPIDGTMRHFSRRDGVKEELYEASYANWTHGVADCEWNSSFRLPGDRIPTWRSDPSKAPEPVVDPTNDNLWYFFVFSEKVYNPQIQRWCIADAFHWQRGVGCVPMGAPLNFRTVPSALK